MHWINFVNKVGSRRLGALEVRALSALPFQASSSTLAARSLPQVRVRCPVELATFR